MKNLFRMMALALCLSLTAGLITGCEEKKADPPAETTATDNADDKNGAEAEAKPAEGETAAGEADKPAEGEGDKPAEGEGDKPAEGEEGAAAEGDGESQPADEKK